MPIRTSKAAHEYPYGRPRQVGEAFQVEPSDVHVMLLLGRIEPEAGEPGYLPVEPKPEPEKQVYQTRDMTAMSRGKRRARNA